MSEITRTPGPWTAFYKHKYDEWHVSIPFPPGSMKLTLFNNGVPGDNPEGDAHLIAAAPDLLGALRFILAFYEPGQRYLDTEAWKQAEASGRAAVAKAEGRS